MSRYLTIIFSLLLMAYLVIALTVTANEADTEPCSGMQITVTGSDGDRHFVTPAELARELDSLPEKARGMALGNINTQQIRRRLLEMDKIEDAEVVRYTDGSIRIKATPIIPVARIFDDGESYYINRSGKRISADARYHKDVPVIEGHFDKKDSVFTPESLLPLLNYISGDSVWNSYISMIKVKSPSDIILVPVIREHVINLGTPDNFTDKFARLKKFYSKVLPLQGWEKYDTLSLKWSGQLVASKRRRASAKVATVQYDDDESVDPGTMLAGDNVAPGQAIPGKKAHNDKPIPAAAPATQQPKAPATAGDQSKTDKPKDKPNQ